MPKRDDVVRRTDKRPVLSRRDVLAGWAALCLADTRGIADAAGTSMRIGVVAGLGIERAIVDDVSRGGWGRRAVIVPFLSWGALRDHASVASGGLIDAAVLPQRAERGAVLPPFRTLPTVLVRGHAGGGAIGVSLRDPRSDAAVRSLWADAGAITLIDLAPAALAGNVAAGLLAGAVLVGDGVVEEAARHGLDAQPVDAATAAELVPPLALFACPACHCAIAGA